MSGDGIEEKVERIRRAYERLDDAQSNALTAAKLATGEKVPKWVKKVDIGEKISGMAGSIAKLLMGKPATAMRNAVAAAINYGNSGGPRLAELSGPSDETDETDFVQVSKAMLIGTYDALAELTGVSSEDGWRPGKVTDGGLRKIKNAVAKTIPTSMRSADATAPRDVASGIDLYIGVAAHSLFEALGKILDFVSIVGEAKKASSDEEPQREKTYSEAIQADRDAKKKAAPCDGETQAREASSNEEPQREKTLADGLVAKACDDGHAKAENTPPAADVNADRKLPDISGIKGHDGNDNDGLEL